MSHDSTVVRSAGLAVAGITAGIYVQSPWGGAFAKSKCAGAALPHRTTKHVTGVRSRKWKANRPIFDWKRRSTDLSGQDISVMET